MSDGEGLWVDGEDISTARLSDDLTLLCSRGPISGSWYIEVFGTAIRNRDTREAAKRAAERAAWDVLAGALARLPVPEERKRAIRSAFGCHLYDDDAVCAALAAALKGE